MDNILVIDSGNILEFDTLINLLNKNDSHFERMVLQLGDRCAVLIFEMAQITGIKE
ncbi:hypothetical protein B4U80_08521 [Leptotrombidium deliense]|uniref:Uncharacterized protein n=1 Tax=Leptotrombidium deliense TaxID=299467 RepID=A0A443S6U5_9ACAR|nr:hypothetical protein B4U80_08521 [Leptotrombidium deliense]